MNSSAGRKMASAVTADAAVDAAAAADMAADAVSVLSVTNFAEVGSHAQPKDAGMFESEKQSE